MARPGLIALMILFAIVNFTTEMSYVLFTPLFLSFASPPRSAQRFRWAVSVICSGVS